MAISSAMMDVHGPFQLLHPLTLRLQCHQTAAFIYLFIIPEASDSQQGLYPNSLNEE